MGVFDDLFGDTFDFNGDGNVDFVEEMLAFDSLLESTKDDDDFDDSFCDYDDEDEFDGEY